MHSPTLRKTGQRRRLLSSSFQLGKTVVMAIVVGSVPLSEAADMRLDPLKAREQDVVTPDIPLPCDEPEQGTAGTCRGKPPSLANPAFRYGATSPRIQ